MLVRLVFIREGVAAVELILLVVLLDAILWLLVVVGVED
jgi:hypothetical protein